ncbi:hypothetical protein [Streptomyces sp. NPDC007991]|uniref:hypothetical protein n=1 Tax=Streptomyces sp. NPDC007991 TaxID=3364803 RepID=UPI0036F10D72
MIPRPAVPYRAARWSCGVDHIDTADFHVSAGGAVRANTLIRETLFPYPSNLVIATKVGHIVRESGYTQGTAAGMRGLVEADLESLGLGRPA